MITFLPYKEFESVGLLDPKRLFKQVVEAKQMIDALTLHNNLRIEHHPATQAWKNNIDALRLYYNVCLGIAKKNGFRTSMMFLQLESTPTYPWWLGKENYHKAMRSRLFDKDGQYYQLFSKDNGYNQGNYWYPFPDIENFFRQDSRLLFIKDYVDEPTERDTYVYEDQWRFSTMKVVFNKLDKLEYIFMRLDKYVHFKARKVEDHFVRDDGNKFKLINIKTKYQR